MKKKKPQESTSAEAVEEGKVVKKNRLAGMLEAMEKRSDPMKAHQVATEYFKVFRSERGLPIEEKKSEDIERNLEAKSEEVISIEEVKELPSSTPVITPVETPVISKRKKQETFEPLDATHTSSETRVYSTMYRETISKGTNTQYFGTKRLMTLTGIRGDHTVRRAIDGLIAKKSIEIIDPNYGNHIGPRYRIYSPKEIFERRKEAGIEIDPQTKKIVTPITTPVETPVKMTGVTPVKTTPVTPVKMTGDILNINKIDDASYESSSKSSIGDTNDDSDDVFFSHKEYIISLYEKYTGNQWRVGDEEAYESVKDILPDIIEAAIIASVLRCQTKVNSFTYCTGAIDEFKELLPPGYLSYLREKFKEKEG